MPAQSGGAEIADGWQATFTRGYIEAGGDAGLLGHIINDVLPCEWRPDVWVGGNGYLSRAQFDPASWERAGGGEPSDDRVVGRNVANWLEIIGVENAGTTAGWPTCWWR